MHYNDIHKVCDILIEFCYAIYAQLYKNPKQYNVCFILSLARDSLTSDSYVIHRPTFLFGLVSRQSCPRVKTFVAKLLVP